jgi:hypothetical protein
MAKSGKGMLSGLKNHSPKQMAAGDPKMATSYPSVDKDATRTGVAPTPKTLGGRDA